MSKVGLKLQSLKTLPNKLTLARVALIPILLLIYPLAYEFVFVRFFCAGLFFLAAVTDFFDGYLARKYGNVTPLGSLLDPVADKMLVASMIVILAYAGYLPAFLGGLLICREVAVSGLRLAACHQGLQIEVDSFGKIKTAVQMLAFLCLTIHVEPLIDIGLVSVWIALGLSYYSAYLYWSIFWSKSKSQFVEEENPPVEDSAPES